MAVGESADELDAAGTNLTVGGPDELNVNGMTTLPATHSDPERYATYSGTKPLVAVSAPETRHVGTNSRAQSTPNVRKGAVNGVVDGQVDSVFTTSDSVKSQSMKRKLSDQLTPAEPNAKSRARLRSAAAASDWFKTPGGNLAVNHPTTLLGSVKHVDTLRISETTPAKPSEPSFAQPIMYRVRNKEAASAIQHSLTFDQVLRTHAHDSNDTQAYHADEEAAAAAESPNFVAHVWNADHDAATHNAL